MQQESTDISEQSSQYNRLAENDTNTQYGILQDHEPNDLHRVRSNASSSTSARSVRSGRQGSRDELDPDTLDEKLRGLSLRGKGSSRSRRAAPGQRISEYENALTPPTPRQALGFKVIKRRDAASDGPQLSDFPNGKP